MCFLEHLSCQTSKSASSPCEFLTWELGDRYAKPSLRNKRVVNVSSTCPSLFSHWQSLTHWPCLPSLAEAVQRLVQDIGSQNRDVLHLWPSIYEHNLANLANPPTHSNSKNDRIPLDPEGWTSRMPTARRHKASHGKACFRFGRMLVTLLVQIHPSRILHDWHHWKHGLFFGADGANRLRISKSVKNAFALGAHCPVLNNFR